MLPLIVFGLGYHASGFDCFDSSWSESVSLEERDVIYARLGDRVRVGLLTVVALGLVPLLTTVLARRRFGEHWSLLTVLLVPAVWFIYYFAYRVSFWAFSCIG